MNPVSIKIAFLIKHKNIISMTYVKLVINYRGVDLQDALLGAIHV